MYESYCTLTPWGILSKNINCLVCNRLWAMLYFTKYSLAHGHFFMGNTLIP